MILDEDQPSLIELHYLHRLVTEVVPFHRLRPAQELLIGDEYVRGYAPLILADADRSIVAAYFPAGGSARLDLSARAAYAKRWYDTTTGRLSDGASVLPDHTFHSPADPSATRPQDWVLLLTTNEA
jgi:hypothetical protein